MKKLDENVYYNAAILMNAKYTRFVDDGRLRQTIDYACEAISVEMHGRWGSDLPTSKYQRLLHKMFDDEGDQGAYLQDEEIRITALLFMYEMTKGE